jgi:tRNA (guanine9-N1)-methyltransferase
MAHLEERTPFEPPTLEETGGQAISSINNGAVSLRYRSYTPNSTVAETPAAGQRIVIDCEFGHLMHDREHVSLVQQIMYCYGRNKRVREAPCGLHLTGVDAGFRRRLTRISGFDNWIGCTTTDRPYIRTFDKSSLVYLTADSPITVETLDPSKTYIIGGIVDRNRHNNWTMNKAAAQGIATANLPIRGHLERLNCSDVLTVDQVFALLISYMDQGDWGVAVESSVPQRKRK